MTVAELRSRLGQTQTEVKALREAHDATRAELQQANDLLRMRDATISSLKREVAKERQHLDDMSVQLQATQTRERDALNRCEHHSEGGSVARPTKKSRQSR